METLDGNAIGGSLWEVFGSDMTNASGACAYCATVSRIAELVVYDRAPGSVARCRSCGSVVIVLVNVRDRVRCDYAGFTLRQPGLEPVASYTLNPRAVKRCEERIRARQYVLRSEWNAVQPKAADQDAYLKNHSWEDYAEWHLGLTEGRPRPHQGALRVRLRGLPARAPHGADRLRVPSQRMASQGRSSWPLTTSCSCWTPSAADRGVRDHARALSTGINWSPQPDGAPAPGRGPHVADPAPVPGRVRRLRRLQPDDRDLHPAAAAARRGDAGPRARPPPPAPSCWGSCWRCTRWPSSWPLR